MPTTGGMKTRCWRNARNLPQKSKPCAFAARIRLEASGEVVEGVPYEDVCKERV